MAKHWTELTWSCNHEVAKLRQAFLEEHKRADQIVFNKNWVPYQAIYLSPECPGYGKTYEDVPMPILPMKDVNP